MVYSIPQWISDCKQDFVSTAMLNGSHKDSSIIKARSNLTSLFFTSLFSWTVVLIEMSGHLSDKRRVTYRSPPMLFERSPLSIRLILITLVSSYTQLEISSLVRRSYSRSTRGEGHGIAQLITTRLFSLTKKTPSGHSQREVLEINRKSILSWNLLDCSLELSTHSPPHRRSGNHETRSRLLLTSFPQRVAEKESSFGCFENSRQKISRKKKITS